MVRSGFLRLTAALGLAIHLGFGVWHFFMPRRCGWYDQLAGMPAELTNAVGAANFFLAVTMLLLGLGVLGVIIWSWGNTRGVTFALGGMALLWALRAGYQLLRPLGTAIPGLGVILLVVFCLTAACFAVPAALVHRSL